MSAEPESDQEYLTRVRAAVEARREKMVDLLLEFCAIAAENPPGAELVASQAFLLSALAGSEVPATVYETSLAQDGEQCVIVGSVGESGPHAYLHGHYDVVPAADPDQFRPVVRAGAVYGRGASDMKGGIVAMLIAALVHRDLGGGGAVRLVLVPDEETGGAQGSERLAELGLITAQGCVGAIVGEPSHPAAWYAARGAFTIRVTVRGRSAHVGLHFEGVNAFERAHALVARLVEYRDTVVAPRTTGLDIEPAAARGSILLIGGLASGGTNFNIVPDEFSFTVDRRPNPDEDYGAACRELLDVIGQFAADRGHDVEVEVLQDVQPARPDPDDVLARTLKQASRAVTGDRDLRLAMCPGCLETRVYTRIGIPAIAYGPGPAKQMHAPGEHVPIDNLVEAACVYAVTLRQLLGAA